MPVVLRVPSGVRSTAHGSTTAGSGRAAFSGAGTPSANADSSASSYSSGASVAAHQTRRSGMARRNWSQNADAAGLRSPGTVFWIAPTRPATDPGVEPMNSTGCDGSQNEFSRAWSSFETGRAPSRRRSGTRSSHLPTSERSIDADGAGAGSSNRNTPGAP